MIKGIAQLNYIMARPDVYRHTCTYVNLTSIFSSHLGYAALVSINPSYTISCFLLMFLVVEHNINVGFVTGLRVA